MKSARILILIFLFLLFITDNLICQQWQIAKHAGGLGYDASHTITIDLSGNVYFGGSFLGVSYFDQETVASNGSRDYFIAKYSKIGSLLWIKHGGGVSTGMQSGDYIADISITHQNDVIVTGSFNDHTSFGNQTLNSSGFANAFIVKFDSNGNCLWARKIGGQNMDYGWKIVIDDNDDIYVLGASTSPVISAGNINLALNAHKFFLTRLDKNGNFKWLKTVSGAGWFEATDMKLFSNNLYLTGGYSGQINIGTTTLNTSQDFLPFLAKFDTSGAGIWANSYNCENYGAAITIAISNSGKIFCGGWTNGNMILGGDTAKNYVGFLFQADTNGNNYWLRPMGLNATSVNVTQNNQILASGTWDDTCKFANCELIGSTSNSARMFVAKLDSIGNCEGVIQVENVPGIHQTSLDSHDQLYVTGSCFSTEFGNINIGNYGNTDAFWAKLDYVSGFEENESGGDPNLYIYANPNPGIFNLKVPQEVMNEKDLVLKIFDNSNRLVKTQQLDMTEENLHVEVPDSKPGIYYLQLLSKKRTYSGKMIVQ